MTVLVRLGVVLAVAGLGMTVYLIDIHSRAAPAALAAAAAGAIQAVVAYRMR